MYGEDLGFSLLFPNFSSNALLARGLVVPPGLFPPLALFLLGAPGVFLGPHRFTGVVLTAAPSSSKIYVIVLPIVLVIFVERIGRPAERTATTGHETEKRKEVHAVATTLVAVIVFVNVFVVGGIGVVREPLERRRDLFKSGFVRGYLVGVVAFVGVVLPGQRAPRALDLARVRVRPQPEPAGENQ